MYTYIYLLVSYILYNDIKNYIRFIYFSYSKIRCIIIRCNINNLYKNNLPCLFKIDKNNLK